MSLRLALFIVAFVPACGASYEVVQRSPSSPIGKRHEIVLREPRAGDILVNGAPEAAFLATLPDARRPVWNQLLDAARVGMMAGLLEHRNGLLPGKEGAAPEAVMELRELMLAHQDPREPAKTTVRARLRLLRADGQLADEVIFTSVIPAEVVTQDALESTRERRLRRAGVDLGTQAAAYLRNRAGLRE